MANLEESTPKATVPDWLKNLIAVVFVVLFLVFVGVLAFNVSSADREWGHYLVIFNVVQAFAAAGGGVLLGTTIKAQQVQNAQDKEKTANDKASEMQQRGVTLRNAIQLAAQQSTNSPKKLFSPRRAVRPQQTGETVMYVADVEGESATHWLVDKNETEEVDPELTRLEKLAKDLFGSNPQPSPQDIALSKNGPL
jgi:hypothetical protein